MSKRNTTLQSKKNKQMQSIHSAMMNARTPNIDDKEHAVFTRIARFRHELVPSEGIYVLRNFCESKKYDDLIANRFIKHDYEIFNITSFTLNETHDVSDLMAWSSEIVYHFADHINRFHDMRDCFYRNIMLGLYYDAEKVLANIEDLFGVSLWLACAKLSLVYFKDDKEGFRELEDKFKEVSCEISKSVLLYSSIKSNSLVSYERYIFAIGKTLEELRILSLREDEDKVLFRHDFDPSYHYETIKSTINHDGDLRLIDLYSNYIRFLSYLHIHGYDLNRLEKSLRRLKDKVSDRALLVIIDRIIGTEERDELDRQQSMVVQKYYSGDFLNAVELSEALLSEYPYISSIYEVYAKSLIEVGQSDSKIGGNIGKIINCMISCIKSGGNSSLLKNVRKMFHVLSFTHWGYGLKAFADTYNGDVSSSVKPIYDFNDSSSLRFSFLSMKDISKLDLVNTGLYETFDEIRKIKISSDIALYKKNYGVALKGYQSLLDFDLNSQQKTGVTSKIIDCFVMSGREQDAVFILAEQIRQGASIRGFSIIPLARYIVKSSIISKCASELEDKSLILNYYNKNIQPDHVDVVANIVENILEINGHLERNSFVENVEKYSTLFILDVLTEDVLESMTLVFSSKKQVLLTRMQILKAFISKFGTHTTEENIKRAISEYESIYVKVVAAICSIEVGAGKIFVDKLPLKQRLLEKVESEIKSISSIKKEKLGFLGESIINSPDDEYEYLVIKDDFHRKIYELVLDIAEEYTINKLYGLDQSLNVGIRHGYMISLLWGPLRVNNLAANKIKDGRFIADESWKNNFAINFNYRRKDVQDALVTKILEFNKNISNLILKYRDRVHVNTGEFLQQDKLFNYYFSVEDVEFFGDKLELWGSENLITEVFNKLDEMTEMCLVDIRGKYISEFKSEIENIFVDFEESIYVISSEDFVKSVKLSKSQMLTRVDEFSTWFDWMKYANMNFTLQVALEKSIEIEKQLHSPLLLDMKLNNRSERVFDGEHFTKFVELFSLIIDNACKHSGFEDSLEIHFDLIEDNNFFTIKARNRLVNFSEAAVSVIANIADKVNHDFIDGAARDSKSGIYKIKRTFSSDVFTDSRIDVFFEQEFFCISINFTYKG